MPVSSTLYMQQHHKEHEEVRKALARADQALRDLVSTNRKLQNATKLYRERYEGLRDEREGERNG